MEFFATEENIPEVSRSEIELTSASTFNKDKKLKRLKHQVKISFKDINYKVKV